MVRAAVTAGAAAAALTLASSPATAQRALGPDAAACNARSGRTALLVEVRGFRSRAGTLRVQLYGSNPAEFLARGRWLRRVDLPVARSGAMPVCVAVPRPGRYAVAVRHDENGNGRSDWSDGGGFSRNPQLALAAPRPSFDDVAIDVRRRLERVQIVLNYRSGFSIAPVAAGGR